MGTAAQQKHLYLISTSQEKQQAESKNKFCQKAADGASVAECTNDKISTNWFDGDTEARYMIWFFRFEIKTPHNYVDPYWCFVCLHWRRGPSHNQNQIKYNHNQNRCNSKADHAGSLWR